MAIAKQTTLWTGFPGAPGYTQLYWADAPGPNIPALQAFWTGIMDRLPTNVTIQVQSSGDRVDEATGAVIGAWSAAAVGSLVGTMGGAYAGPSGAHINWRTTTIVAGRRLKGRSFLVPLGGAAYDSDGTIAAASLTDLRANLATFVAAAGADLRVWHRPINGSGGSIGAVTSADIPDKTAVLRSRRD